jgi:hypothetical protein
LRIGDAHRVEIALSRVDENDRRNAIHEVQSTPGQAKYNGLLSPTIVAIIGQIGRLTNDTELVPGGFKRASCNRLVDL